MFREEFSGAMVGLSVGGVILTEVEIHHLYRHVDITVCGINLIIIVLWYKNVTS